MKRKVLIVGANGGLAKETIKHLINDGFETIIMACRTKKKGEIAKKAVLNQLEEVPNLNLEVVDGFDMNNPLILEISIKKLSAKGVKFTHVFLAAANPVFSNQFQSIEWNHKTIEKNVFQNMIGSHITLSKLVKYKMLEHGARVVMSGGEGARGLKGMIDKPHFSSSQELRNYVYCKSNLKYNAMNALGVSKYFGALWVSKISLLKSNAFEIIWFSPGLTYGTEGLKGLPPLKKWFMKNVMFGIMRLFGQAQSPSKGGRKFADCIKGTIGVNGALLGAPAGKAIGEITDQTPMNSDFTNPVLIDEFWNILEEVSGPFGS